MKENGAPNIDKQINEKHIGETRELCGYANFDRFIFLSILSQQKGTLNSTRKLLLIIQLVRFTMFAFFCVSTLASTITNLIKTIKIKKRMLSLVYDTIRYDRDLINQISLYLMMN